MLGGCFEIGCQQRIIYSGVVLLLLICGYVWLVVAMRRVLHICFEIVFFLVQFGLIYTGGWAYR